jgi:hypothetical protein
MAGCGRGSRPDGETVPPERLFRDYTYASSVSDTMVEHARTLVEALIERYDLGSTSRVIEVASNDGYLLQFYKARGIRVLGIEPAANIADLAIKKGISTLVEFFDEGLARRLAARGELAEVIHAHNVPIRTHIERESPQAIFAKRQGF